jgi:hypothetical protein
MRHAHYSWLPEAPALEQSWPGHPSSPEFWLRLRRNSSMAAHLTAAKQSVNAGHAGGKWVNGGAAPSFYPEPIHPCGAGRAVLAPHDVRLGTPTGSKGGSGTQHKIAVAKT